MIEAMTREEKKTLLGLFVFGAAVVGMVALVCWAVLHDYNELEAQREAVRVMARVEHLRAMDAWSEQGRNGNSFMDFVNPKLLANDVARAAISNAWENP